MSSVPGILSDSMFFRASKHSVWVKEPSDKVCSSLVKEVEFTSERNVDWRLSGFFWRIKVFVKSTSAHYFIIKLGSVGKFSGEEVFYSQCYTWWILTMIECKTCFVKDFSDWDDPVIGGEGRFPAGINIRYPHIKECVKLKPSDRIVIKRTIYKYLFGNKNDWSRSGST